MVDLEEQPVASLLLDSAAIQSHQAHVVVELFERNIRLNSNGIGDSQIITDDLNTSRLSQVSPSGPIVLVERILDRDDVVFLGVRNVEIGEFDSGEPFGRVGLRVLEVEIVLSVLVELRRASVNSFNFDEFDSLRRKRRRCDGQVRIRQMRRWIETTHRPILTFPA